MSRAVAELAQILKRQSSLQPEGVLLTALEGLSNAGKSTLGGSLEATLTQDGTHCISIDADKFHYGKKPAMAVYNDLVARRERGEELPADVPDLIWDYRKLEHQLLLPVVDFEKSDAPNTILKLTGVLREKADGTEHDETYLVKRGTILLVPGMYLRHLPGFDFIVYLEANMETLIQRKLERSARIGHVRDPSLTRKMVELIEHPVMVEHIKRHPVKRGIAFNTNDFDNTYLSEVSPV